MEAISKINMEMLSVTGTIQNEFPELYKHLGETPMFLSNEDTEIRINECREYLESIQIQLSVLEITKSSNLNAVR